MKISGGERETKEDLVRAKMPRYSLNEIVAAGDLVIEGALQLAKLFIMICGFVKFAFAPVPGQNFPGVFEVGPKSGKGKKTRQEESDDDSDGYASGAEAAAARAVRMLSGNGADDLHYIITNLEGLCTRLFAFTRSRDFEDAEKNSLSFAFGNWAQFLELRDCLTDLKAAAPDFYSIPKSQLAHYDNKVTVLATACERREIECGLVGRLLEVDYFRRLTPGEC